MRHSFSTFRTRAEVLAAIGAFALLALPASAQTTHTVCASSCDYTSIQAAVSAAAAGDIVSVQAGTYTENISINKSLTLTGAGIGQSIIQGMSGQGKLGSIVVTTGIDNVTIEGFTVEGIDNGAAGIENAAVYIQGSGQDNLTISNNRIVANGDLALLAEYGAVMTNVSVTGNTFSGKTFVGAAPAVGGQFTVNNAPRQLVVFGNGGGATTSNITGFVFTGNTFDGTTGVGNVSNYLATLDVSNGTITNNTFAGQLGGFSAQLRVRRGGNTISGNTFITTGLLGSATALEVANQTGTVGALVAANTFDRAVYMNTTGTGAVGVNLQAAINAAPAGSTVNFLGTHVTNAAVVISKSLTLEGAGESSTTIDIRTGTGYNVRTTADNVTLRGFTLLPDTAKYYGIKVENKTAGVKTQGVTIENVTVTGGKQTAVDINGAVGVTLNNVTARNSFKGRGINLTDVENVTLTNITTSGNAWGGIAITTHGRYLPLGSKNISISGLNASELNPLDFDMGNYANPADPRMPENVTFPAGLDNYVVKRPAGSNSADFTLWSFTSSKTDAEALAALTPGSVVVSAVPVVNTPLPAYTTPATFTFSALPSNPQRLNVAFEPLVPQNSSVHLPDPATAIPGAGDVLPATLTVTSGMANYTFRTTVTLDVSAIPGFGPSTQVAYFNTTTNTYVPIAGTYAAGPPATFTFETDHFTTFVFYNGSAADPMDLYVSRTTAQPATGEEFITPDGPTWTETASANAANDWTYTGQTATFNVVPTFPAGFDGFSSMHLVFQYDATAMAYTGATFNGDWNSKQCQAGIPSAGHITCDMSLMGATEVATAMSGAAVSLGFTISRPGYSVLDVIGADVRKLNGAAPATGVAVRTHGGGLRNYLGDLAARTGSSTTDLTKGDGKVDGTDLQVFSSTYWVGVPGYSGSNVYLYKADIGPTSTNTVYGVPTLDGKIDFEDLVIFAASYGLSARSVYQGAQPGEEQVQATREAVRVIAGTPSRTGDRVSVPVELSSVSDLRGGSFVIDLGMGAEVVGARFGGRLVTGQQGLAFARAEGSGRVRLDAAVLGEETLHGDGGLVELVVRTSGAELPTARVISADLRDGQGRVVPSEVAGVVGTEAVALPTELALEGVFPNPARARASVRVAVPQAQAVEVRVYDLLGREVLTVHQGELAAGRHDLAIATEGLANGRYIVRMEAGTFSRVTSLTVVR